MTRRRSPLRVRLTALGYGVFYRLPHKVRMRLVRLATPKYTIGAVGLIFDSEAADPGRILLLRQPPGRGWTLPAGLLGRRETPLTGAIREIAEETGIELTADQIEPAVPSAVVHTNGQWVDTVFRVRVSAATTMLDVDGAEVFEAAWHSLDELPNLTPATARLLAVYGIGPLAS